MTDFVDEVITDVENLGKEAEEIFTPKPGGLVDTWRKRMATEEARAQEAANEAEKINERGVKAVKVAQIAPEVFHAQTVNVGAGSAAMVLPSDAYRSRAVVRVATQPMPSNPPAVPYSVVLGKDQSAAFSGAGYTLLSSDEPLELHSRAQLWAYNAGDSVLQVSVISENYSAEC